MHWLICYEACNKVDHLFLSWLAGLISITLFTLCRMSGLKSRAPVHITASITSTCICSLLAQLGSLAQQRSLAQRSLAPASVVSLHSKDTRCGSLRAQSWVGVSRVRTQRSCGSKRRAPSWVVCVHVCMCVFCVYVHVCECACVCACVHVCV